MTTYGFAEDAQVRALNVRAEAGRMHFTVRRSNGQSYPDLDVVLSLPGEHNVLNALSAVAVAMELEIADEALLRAFESFRAWAGASSAMANSLQRTVASSPSSTTTGTTLSRWRPRWLLRAAPSRAAAWCWPSSRTATAARAIASRISSRSSAWPMPCC